MANPFLSSFLSSPRFSTMLSNGLLPLYILLHHFALPLLASIPGSLALFLDSSCYQASIINPSVNVPVDTCLVTPGAEGIAIETLPPCTSGNATLILYKDTSCANQDTSGIQFSLEKCSFDGGGVPAVLFACNQAAKGAIATAISTVSAGSSSLPITVNTPVPTSPGGTAEQTTPASNGASTTSTTASSTTASNSSQTNTKSGGNGSGSAGSGLSQKGQIALGIVLPVATIVVALLTWWFPCRKRRRRHGQADQYNLVQSPSHGLARPIALPGENHQGPRFLGVQGYEGRPR